MIGYVGTYRVLAPLDLTTGKTTPNENDTYLLGKYQIECYRIDDNTLAIYLPTGNNAANIILPQLEDLSMELTLRLDGDFESVYTFTIYLL